MKNTYKLLSIIAMVAVIAFSFTACEEGDPGDDGVKKFMTITNIPNDVTQQLTFGLATKNKKTGEIEAYAIAKATPSGGKVEHLPLVSTTTELQFTGTGDFYVIIIVGAQGQPGYKTLYYTGAAGSSTPIQYTVQKGSVTDTSVISWNLFNELS